MALILLQGPVQSGHSTNPGRKTSVNTNVNTICLANVYEYLLCTRHGSRCGGSRSKLNTKVLLSLS